MPAIEEKELEPAATTAKGTLAYYWNLASIEEKVRTEAAFQLVSALQSLQNAHQQEAGLPTKVLADVEDIKAASATDVSYALKRLLRGLSSSRDGARQGFSVALTELLTLIPMLPTALVLELLHDISEKNGKKTGQEERELYFARIFGYHAIALSGLLQKETLTFPADVQTMVDALVEFASEKEYLKQSCSFVVLSILKAVQEHPDHGAEMSTAIITTYLKSGVSTPEHVWFVLEAQNACK
ncbi:DNA-directed DNA polymerase, partial [Kappamyces sp. JEL0680]